MNVNQAIRVAADHAFTMFGGVRQIFPKTYILFVPKQATVDESVIKAAADKLKSAGVRLMIVGLDKYLDKTFYKGISSQPSGRYVLSGFDMQELIKVATYEAAEAICKGKITNIFTLL